MSITMLRLPESLEKDFDMFETAIEQYIAITLVSRKLKNSFHRLLPKLMFLQEL